VNARDANKRRLHICSQQTAKDAPIGHFGGIIACNFVYESVQMFQSPLPLKDGLGMDRGESINASVPAAHNISRLISALRRQARVVIACCLAGGAVGTVVIMTATPLYTASAAIIVDNRQVRVLRDITLPDSPDEVESQVEVIRSEQVGLAVVKQLKLSEDPALVAQTTWSLQCLGR
jgi:hypothetical protein